MDTFQQSVLPVTTSSLTDVLQTLAALQACPSTSTALPNLSNLSFSTSIPSVNLYPPPAPPMAIPVQTFLHPAPLLPQATPSAVEALANALLVATTSRRASCPEPPVSTSQTLPTLSVDSPAERRRYSETNLDVLIREQLAQMMPSNAQLPGMPGCYFQHVPTGVQTVGGGVEQSRVMGGVGGRRAGHRKARTIYGSTQTQQLEDMFRGQMYVVGAERESLAHRLGLSPSQVRIWFQNRRSKHRRKQQEQSSSTQHKEDEEAEDTE